MRSVERWKECSMRSMGRGGELHEISGEVERMFHEINGEGR